MKIDVEKQAEQQTRPWKLFERFDIIGGDGSLYMRRWHIIGTPWFALMLHRFVRGDEDRCLHDHPWWFVSVILWGGYYEETECDLCPTRNKRWYPPGSVLYRPAKWVHRVLLRPSGDTWTLVLRGKRERVWGFWTKTGWVERFKFLQGKNEGKSDC